MTPALWSLFCRYPDVRVTFWRDEPSDTIFYRLERAGAENCEAMTRETQGALLDWETAARDLERGLERFMAPVAARQNHAPPRA